MALKIVTLNCWMGVMYHNLFPFVKKVDADVLCFQEIFSTNLPHPCQAAFPLKDDSMLVRPRLFQELQEQLPGYVGYFCPQSTGALGARGQYKNIDYGIATFVKKHVPVIEQRVAFVHKWYSPNGWGENPRPRNVHMVRLFDSKSGQETVVVHLHGLWIPEGKIETPYRDAQLSRLCYRLSQFVDMERGKVVLCGDFNVLPDSYTYRELVKFGFRELVTKNGLTDTRTSLYKKPDRFADYMFVSESVNPFFFDAPAEPLASDHRPLIVEIE